MSDFQGSYTCLEKISSGIHNHNLAVISRTRKITQKGPIRHEIYVYKSIISSLLVSELQRPVSSLLKISMI